MERLITDYRKIFFNVEIIQKPIKTIISGFEASYIRLTSNYKLKDGRSYPTSSEQWLVFTNEIYFIVTTSIVQDESKVIKDEIGRIVGSIKIDHYSQSY